MWERVIYRDATNKIREDEAKGGLDIIVVYRLDGWIELLRGLVFQ